MKPPLLVLAVAAVALGGCGQKGALYLPKKGTVVTRPAGAQPGATAPATPAGGATAPKPDDKKDEDAPKPNIK